MTQSAELRRLVRLASGYNRKARAYGVRGTVSGEDLLLVEEVDDRCHYCGIDLEKGHGSFDHVWSLGMGGSNTIENIVRCCMTCQRKKFTKTPDEYATHTALRVECVVCGAEFQPRWAEYRRGMARTCSRSCAAKKRWRDQA